MAASGRKKENSKRKMISSEERIISSRADARLFFIKKRMETKTQHDASQDAAVYRTFRNGYTVTGKSIIVAGYYEGNFVQ